MKKQIVFLSCILIICLLAGGFCLYKIYEQKAEVSEAERLAEEFSAYSPGELFKEGAEPKDIYNEFLPKLKELKAQNGDVMGWIYIPLTNIDYPLLQGKDNEYYLTHSVSGKFSAAGSVFVDKRGLGCENTIIYAHNMGRASNVMFHDITKFADDDFFDNALYGYIITERVVTELDIFAFSHTVALSGFYEDKADYDFIEKNSENFREPTEGGELYTLSTCDYSYNGARAVLSCIGFEIYESED